MLSIGYFSPDIVLGSGLRDLVGLGFRVQGLESLVYGTGFRVFNSRMGQSLWGLRWSKHHKTFSSC